MRSMQKKTARSAVAHAGIGISPARRSLAKGGYQWGTGWKVNAAVLISLIAKMATPP
jgi:hypothetical protein